MSTIPLFPPDRSHICMAFASELCAQAFAGSGVGAAAAALADASALGEAASLADADAVADSPAADAAAAEAAGAEAADGAAGPPVDAAGPDVPLHAANRRIPTNARAGNLRRLLIPCSSTLEPTGLPRSHRWPSPADGRLARTQSSERIRLLRFSVPKTNHGTVGGSRDGPAPRCRSVEPGERLADVPRRRTPGGRAWLRAPLDVGPPLRDLRRSAPADP